MDRLYYFIYSCINRGLGQAERAAFVLSIFTSLLFASFYCQVTILVHKGIKTPLLYSILFSSIVLAIFIFNSKYFVKSGRYRRIVENFGTVRKLSKRRRALNLGIIIIAIIVAFMLFVYSGINLAKHLNI